MNDIIHFLSLGQTQALSEILDSRDWSALEDFIIEKGFDESDEPHFEYEIIDIHYKHRFARVRT